MKNILKELNACNQAIEWVQDKTIKQAINECEIGDWMLWLFQKLFPDDLQLLTLTKGHCANTVRHLMTDERSLKAIDTAIAFGEGRATRKELDAADAAYAVARRANLLQTANICRNYLGDKLIEGCNKFKEVSNEK